MAVSITSILSDGTQSDGTSDTTASLTTTSEPALACISIMGATAAPLQPTVVSNGSGGKTWTLVTSASQTWRDNGTTTYGSHWIFKGIGAGGSGTVTVTMNVGDSNSTLTGYSEEFVQLSGCATDPVLQVAKSVDLDWDTADTVSATLSNAPVSTSRCFAASMISSTTADVQVPRTNWTQLVDNAISSPSQGQMLQWRSDAAEQTGSVTQGGGNNAQGGIIVLEIGIQTDLSVTAAVGEATASVGGTHVLASELIAAVADSTGSGGVLAPLLTPVMTAAAASVASALATILASRITTPVILADSGVGTNLATYTNTMTRAATANTFVLACIAYSRTNPDIPTAPATVTVSGHAMTLFDDFIYRNVGSDQQAIAVYYGVPTSPSGTTFSISNFGYTASGCQWIVAECPGVLTTGTNGADGIRNQVESVLEDALSAGETIAALTYAASINDATSRPFLFAGMNTSVADSIGIGSATTWSILADNAHTSPSSEIALLWSETTWTSSAIFQNNGISTWKAGGIAFELVEGLPNFVFTIFAADATASADIPTLSSTLPGVIAAAVADAGVDDALVTVPLVVSDATADALVLGGLPVAIQMQVAEAFATGLPVFIPIVFIPTGRLGADESLGGNIVLGEPGFVPGADINIEILEAANADASIGDPAPTVTVLPDVGDSTASAPDPLVFLLMVHPAADSAASAGVPVPTLTFLVDTVAEATAEGLTVTVIGIDRAGVLFWTDFRVGDAPPAGVVYYAELEVPDGANRALLYFAEFETAFLRSILYFAELETPNLDVGDRASRLTWVRFGVPKRPRRGEGPVDRWHRSDVHHW